jgi:hypothetical protein
VASLFPAPVPMLLRPFSSAVWSQLLPLSPFWRAGPPRFPRWLPFPQDPDTLPPHCLLQLSFYEDNMLPVRVRSPRIHRPTPHYAIRLDQLDHPPVLPSGPPRLQTASIA